MRRSSARKSIRRGIPALMGVWLCLPGCIIIGNRDRYTYDRSASSQSGVFCPYTYLWENTKTVTLPLFRVENETLPHDLRMLTFDQTYSKTHKGFERFVVDTMTVEFANGETVAIISSDTPISERTFVIPKDREVFSDDATRVFKGVITQRASFTLRISGTAIGDDGESVPFESNTTYRYDGQNRTFHTIFDEWANC